MDAVARTRKCRDIKFHRSGLRIDKYHYCDRDPPYCDACPVGKISNRTDPDPRKWTECQDCEPGKFNDKTGQTVCSLCAKGTYQDTFGQSTCTSCENDTETTASTGSTRLFDCVCRKGFSMELCPPMHRTKQWREADPQRTHMNKADQDVYRKCRIFKDTAESWFDWLHNGVCQEEKDPCTISKYFKFTDFEYDREFYNEKRIIKAGVAVNFDAPPDQVRVFRCSNVSDDSTCTHLFNETWSRRNVDDWDHDTFFANQMLSSSLDQKEDANATQYEFVVPAGTTWLKLEARKFSNRLYSLERKCEGFDYDHTGLFWYADEWVRCKYYCTPCEEGKFQADINKTACEKCAKGKYQENTQKSSCDDCPAGTEGIDPGLDNQDFCEPCSAGKFSVSGSSACTQCPDHSNSEEKSQSKEYCRCNSGFTGPNGGNCTACEAGFYKNISGSDNCTACTAGTYNVNKASNSSEDCIPCVAGKYSASGASECTACPDDSTSPLGSTNITDCTCLPGYTGTNGENCTPCDAGQYKNISGSASCTSCDKGKYNPRIAMNSSDACLDCEIGEYGENEGSSNCTSCPSDSTTIEKASTDSSDCLCDAGYQTLNDGGCEPCLPGTSKNGTGSIKPCAVCEVGKFANDMAATHCEDCAVGTYTNDTNSSECQTCGRGEYQNLTGQIECRPCTPGRFAANNGSEECSPCEPGSFSNAFNASTCIACQPGEFQNLEAQTECNECEKGTFSSQPNAKECEDCEPGEFQRNKKQTTCVPCRAGTFALSGGSTECKDCDAGKFANLTGMSECFSCEPGKFQKHIRKDYCDDCPMDTYSDVYGAQTCTDCMNNSDTLNKTGSSSRAACSCVASYFLLNNVCEACSYDSQVDCSQCPLGMFKNNEDRCMPCPIGSYGGGGNATECTQCGMGQTTEREGTTNFTQCVCDLGYGGSTCTACPAGTFKPTLGGANCTLCPADTYRRETGATQSTQCLSCMDNSFSERGSTNKIQCQCNAGFTGPNGEPCRSCKAGKYKAETGPAACTNCARGTFNTHNASRSEAACLSCPFFSNSSLGSTSIVNCSCNPGFTGPNGQNCSACQPGTFKNVSGHATCKSCPVNTYQPVFGAAQLSDCLTCGFSSVSLAGSSNRSDCLCAKGHTEAAHGECQACERGTFKPHRGNMPCTNCSAGTFLGETGGFMTGNCSVCETNTFSHAGAVSCEKCPANTSSPRNSSSVSSCQCNQGYTGPDGGLCMACAVGTFKDSVGSAKCSNCSAGTFLAVLGGTASTNCSDCRENTYSLAGAATCILCPGNTSSRAGSPGIQSCKCMPGYTGPDGGLCVACAVGKYKEFNGSAECRNCSAGMYLNARGGIKDTNCFECPRDTYSLQGSAQCENCPGNSTSDAQSPTLSSCECNAGYTGLDGGTCTPCSKGTYKLHLGAATCEPCAAGKYLNELGGTHESNCSACGRDTYSPIASSECFSCPSNSASPEQSTEASNCQCNQGYTGPDGGACEPCEAGKFKSSIGSHSCTACISGTYLNRTGATRQSQCTACPYGSTSNPGSGNITDCQCQRGYQGNRDGEPCEECPPNTYKNEVGSESCTLCDPNAQSPRGSTQQNTCKCNKGYTGQDGLKCSECLAGEYKDNLGNPPCRSCDPGTYSSVIASNTSENCLGCIAGKFSTGGASKCTSCPGNSSSPERSTEASNCKCNRGYTGADGEPCVACAVGKYKEVSGSAECSNCSAGTYLNALGAIFATNCTLCPADTYSFQGANLCTQCTGNSSSPEGSTLDSACKCNRGYTGKDGGPCEACAVGKYKQVSGSAECIDCSAGMYLNARGGIKDTNCSDCPRDTYSLKGSAHCANCPGNSTSETQSPTLSSCECNAGYTGPNGGLCVACAVGKYKEFNGSAECIDCSAGMYLNARGGIKETNCSECPRDTYSLQGAAQCENCPGNSTSDAQSPTLSSCECNAGYTGPDGGRCVACAVGKYKLHLGTAACEQCSAGKYLNERGGTHESNCSVCGPDTYSPIASSTCISCPSNSFSPEQSTEASNCQCNKGYTGPDGGACEACDAGTYKLRTGSESCELCTAGKYSTVTASVTGDTCQTCPGHTNSHAGSDEKTDCICNAGFSGNDGEPCVACNKNTFKPTNGSAACTECDPNAQSERGSVPAESCQCNEGYTGPDGGTCSACAAGEYKSVVGSAACSACNSGSDSPAGSTLQSNCTCNEGYTGPDGGNCEKCDKGKYKSIAGSQDCTECPAGTSYDGTGATSANFCAGCGSNTYSPAGSSGCQPCPGHSVSESNSQYITECKCIAGYQGLIQSTTSTCEPCAAGKYQDLQGQETCTPCGFDKFNPRRASDNASACIACKLNSKTDSEAAVTKDDCKCKPGYKLNNLTDACDPCGTGRFNEETGAEECSICDAGKASQNPTEINPENCKNCSASFYSASGAATCSPCPDRSVSPEASHSIDACECDVGTGCDDLNSCSCQHCIPGKWKPYVGDEKCAECQCLPTEFRVENCYNATNITCQACQVCDTTHDCLYCAQNMVVSNDDVAWNDVHLARDSVFFNFSGQEHFAEKFEIIFGTLIKSHVSQYYDADEYTNETASLTLRRNWAIWQNAGFTITTRIKKDQHPNSDHVLFLIQGAIWSMEMHINPNDISFSDINLKSDTYTSKMTVSSEAGVSDCVVKLGDSEVYTSTETDPQMFEDGKFFNIIWKYDARKYELTVRLENDDGETKSSSCYMSQDVLHDVQEEVRFDAFQTAPEPDAGINVAGFKAYDRLLTDSEIRQSLRNIQEESKDLEHFPQYYKKTCTLDENAECASCSKCDLETQYEEQPCSRLQDSQCADCTICDPDTQYEVTACTKDKDRTCDSCTICEIFEYESRSCSTFLNTNCSLCPVNSHAPEGDKSGIEACRCNAGYTGLNGGPCTACAAGKYKSDYGSAACDLCPANMYQTAIAATTYSSCQPCETNMVSLPGSDVSSHCKCKPGYTGADGTTCTPCDQGEYKPTNGSAPCTACPAGKFLETQGGVAESNCSVCNRNFFSAQGAAKCEECTGNSSSLEASKVSSDCICNKGFTGSDGGPCTACVAGKYKPANGSHACTDCSNGTFLNTKGGHSKNQCVGCESNEFSLSGAATCSGCPGDSSSPAESQNAAACKCNEGFTGPDGGACTACVAGKYKESSGNAQCTECAAGKKSSAIASTNRATCTSCEANFYSLGGNATCTACPRDSSSDLESQNIFACKCNEGYTGPDGGACTACVAGKYKELRGNAQCTECAAGKKSSTIASTTRTTCTSCEANSYSLRGNATCTQCPGNSSSLVQSQNATACKCNEGYTGPDGGLCMACAAGKYKELSGDAQCTECAAGKKSSIIASTTESTCSTCPNDTFSLRGNATCTLCPDHSNSPMQSQTLSSCRCNQGYTGPDGGSCTACAAGKYKPESGDHACTNCRAGTMLPTAGGISHSNCSICSANTFSSEGSAMCTSCPQNSSSPRESTLRVNCTCDVGFTGLDGNSCSHCEWGTFKNVPGSAPCQSCACADTQFITENCEGGRNISCQECQTCNRDMAALYIPEPKIAVEDFDSEHTPHTIISRPDIENECRFWSEWTNPDVTDVKRKVCKSWNGFTSDSLKRGFTYLGTLELDDANFDSTELFYLKLSDFKFELRANNAEPKSLTAVIQHTIAAPTFDEGGSGAEIIQDGTTLTCTVQGFLNSTTNQNGKHLFHISWTFDARKWVQVLRIHPTVDSGSLETVTECQSVRIYPMPDQITSQSLVFARLTVDYQTYSMNMHGYQVFDARLDDEEIEYVLGRIIKKGVDANVTAPEFLTQECQNDTDTQCQLCTQCDRSTEYEKQSCQSEQDTVCTSCTQCDFNYQYENRACSRREDAECKSCTKCSDSGQLILSFCSQFADTVCGNCPQHSIAKREGNNLTHCDCLPGYYGNAGNCTACEAGKYKPTYGSSECTNCGSGKYSTALHATNDSVCTSCPANMSSPEASASIYSCGCIAGLFGGNISSCQKCQAGKYKSTASAEPCDDCPAGKYSAAVGAGLEDTCSSCPQYATSLSGSTVIEACQCSAGTTGNGSEACFPCGHGFFKNTTGDAPCSLCPNQTFTDSDRETSPEGCRTCQTCGINHYTIPCNASHDTQCPQCSQCEDGVTYQEHGCQPFTDTICSPCTVCIQGEEFETQTCTNLTNRACTSCTPCPAGQFEIVKCVGANDTVCSECPSNLDTLPGAVSINACECGAGYFYENKSTLEVCAQCPPGSGKPFGNTLCEPCAPGTYVTNLSGVCLSCPDNSHSGPNSTSAKSCICNAGFSGPDGGPCEPCDPGTFKGDAGSAECTMCPSGQFGVEYNATSNETCLLCEAGKWSGGIVRSVCSACPNNTFSEAGSDKSGCICNAGFTGEDGKDCTACEPGTFKPANGSGACTKCSAGKYNPVYNASRFEDCLECGHGEYQPNSGKERCRSCPGNSSHTCLGQTSQSMCHCNEFFGTRYVDANYNFECQPCSVGEYWLVNLGQECFSPAFTSCEKCDEGKFTNKPIFKSSDCEECKGENRTTPDQTGCEPCPENAETSTPTSTTADCLCKAGYGYTENGTCSACPFNFYKEGRQNSPCLACDEGYVTLFTATSNSSDCFNGCPSDKYLHDRRCVNCPDDSTSIPGSENISQCICNAGFTKKEDETCEACVAGTYSVGGQSSQCEPCPAGTFNAFERKTSIAACQQCPPATYSLPGSRECRNCTDNSNSTPGSTSAGQCQCLPGYTQENEPGVVSADYYHKTDDVNMYSHGDNYVQWGATPMLNNSNIVGFTVIVKAMFHAWRPQKTGVLRDYILVMDTDTSNIDWCRNDDEDCLFVQLDISQQQWNNNDINLELKVKAQNADTTYPGHCVMQSTSNTKFRLNEWNDFVVRYRHYDKTLYLNHADDFYFAEPFFSSTGNSMTCPITLPAQYDYTNVGGFHVQAGYNPTAPWMVGPKNMSVAGAYVFNHWLDDDKVQDILDNIHPHQPDTIVREPRFICTACPLGTFKASQGSAACDECAAGSFTAQEASTNASECSACGYGQYLDTQDAECKTCPLHSNSTPGSTSKADCLCTPGYHGRHDIGCEACDAGKFTDQPGMLNCTSCVAGTYNPDTAASNVSQCRLCGHGTYSLEAAISCQKCITHSNSTPGSTSEADCLCIPGYHGRYNLGCFECNSGKFTDQPGMLRCTSCEAGKYNPGSAANHVSQCLLCDHGKYSSEAAQFCQACTIHSNSTLGRTSPHDCTCLPGYTAKDVPGVIEANYYHKADDVHLWQRTQYDPHHNKDPSNKGVFWGVTPMDTSADIPGFTVILKVMFHAWADWWSPDDILFMDTISAQRKGSCSAQYGDCSYVQLIGGYDDRDNKMVLRLLVKRDEDRGGSGAAGCVLFAEQSLLSLNQWYDVVVSYRNDTNTFYFNLATEGGYGPYPFSKEVEGNSLICPFEFPSQFDHVSIGEKDESMFTEQTRSYRSGPKNMSVAGAYFFHYWLDGTQTDTMLANILPHEPDSIMQKTSVCAACPSGTFKVENGPGNCSDCDAGKFNPEIAATSASQCHLCGYAQYSSVRAAVCENCTQNSNATPGSTQITDCLCHVGFVNTSNGTCQACARGSFKPTIGSGACSMCAAGKYSTVLAAHSASTCHGCDFATFSHAGASACQLCTPNSNSSLNSTSRQDCFCLPGYERDGLEAPNCTACKAGFFKNTSGPGPCSPCPHGTASSQEAATTIKTCGVCPYATYAHSGSASCTSCPRFSNTTHEGSSLFSQCLCLPGTEPDDAQSCKFCVKRYFKSTFSNEACEKCNESPSPDDKAPGGFLNTESKTGATECQVCFQDGKVPSRLQDLCVPCSKVDREALPNAKNNDDCQCKVGKFLQTDKTCQPCPTTTFKDQVGNSQQLCEPCLAGTFTNTTGQSRCHNCSAGTFSDGLVSECALCPRGQFSAPGAAECTPCAKGFFSGTLGSVRCEPCSAGYASNVLGANQCVQCNPGTFTNRSGEQTCMPCPAGHTSNGDNPVECTPCQTGSYAPVSGSPACQGCEPGRFQNDDAALFCKKCADGTFAAGNATECSTCPPGTFARQEAKKCSHCSGNTIAVGLGNAACSPCHANSVANENKDECICDLGHHLTSTGCSACPRNYFKNNISNTGCLPCPPQTESDAGSTSESACRIMTRTQTIVLNAGVTWISFNVQKMITVQGIPMSTSDSVGAVFSNNSTNPSWSQGDSVRNAFKAVHFYTTVNSWLQFPWNLQEITAREMYVVHRATAGVLRYTGMPVELPLTLELTAGDNYIPCPYQTPVPILEYMPQRDDGSDYIYNDQLTSQSASMKYYTKNLVAIGWIGGLTLANFEPGKGYILTVQRSGMYTFPALGNATTRRRLLEWERPGRALLSTGVTYENSMPPQWAEKKMNLDKCLVDNKAVPWTDLYAQVVVDGARQSMGVLAAFREDYLCGVSNIPTPMPSYFGDGNAGDVFFSVKCCAVPGTTGMPIRFEFSTGGAAGSILSVRYPHKVSNFGRRDGKLQWPEKDYQTIGDFAVGLDILTGATKIVSSKPPPSSAPSSSPTKNNDNSDILIILIIYMVFVLLAFATCLSCLCLAKTQLQTKALEMMTLPVVYDPDKQNKGVQRHKLF